MTRPRSFMDDIACVGLGVASPKSRMDQGESPATLATEPSLGAPPGPSAPRHAGGVGDQLAIHGIADAALEGPERLLGGLAAGHLVLEVVPPRPGVANLGHRSDVQRVVQPTVAASRETVALSLSRDASIGAVPLWEA